MALLPEIHVNFDQFTFERFYQIFLPLIPGGTLVGGLIFAHPGPVNTVAVTLGLGRYSRVAVFLCAVYIVGLVLYGFSVVIAGNWSLLLAYAVGARWSQGRPNEQASKNFVWRQVAAEFLGEALTPPNPPQVHPLFGHDVEWQDLYNVLQDYVLRALPLLPNEIALLFTYLQATGWALLYLYFTTAMRGHWSVIVVSITVILFGAGNIFLANFFYWRYDRLSQWAFTARLINEIRMREKSTNAKV